MMFTTDELREMVGSRAVAELPCQLVQPFRGQPRKYFNAARLNSLVRSIKQEGQHKPIEVRVLWGGVSQQFEIVDGERRWRACQALGRPVQALVVDIENVTQQFRRSFVANLHAEAHTPLEIASSLEQVRNSPEILALPKGDQIRAVMDLAGKCHKWVNNYLGLARLAPRLRRLLEPQVEKKKRLPLALAFRLASLPQAEQLPMWDQLRKRKISRKQASREIDKTILKKGLDKTRRGRGPADDLEVVVRLCRRLEEDSSLILDMEDVELQRMIASRSGLERAQLLEKLSMAQSQVARMRQRLQGAVKSAPLPLIQ